MKKKKYVSDQIGYTSRFYGNRTVQESSDDMRVAPHAFEAMRDEVLLSNDLNYNNPKRKHDDGSFNIILSGMSQALCKWFDESSDNELSEAIRIVIGDRRVCGNIIKFEVSPKTIDIDETAKKIRKFCEESKYGLSMFCIDWCARHAIDMFKEGKSYDEYGNERPHPVHFCPERIIYLSTPHNGYEYSQKYEIFITITYRTVSFSVLTHEELNIAREIFHVNDDAVVDGCLVLKDNDIPKARVEYVVQCQGGFNSRSMAVNYIDCDIEFNYNDDLEYQKLQDFVDSTEPGLAILHGHPGTGKTSLIRKLIWDNRTNGKFIVMDKSMFDNISDNSFIMYLMDNVGSVIIFEDCETLLTARENGNSRIDGLLNLSDGILGDMLHMKFLCTFNADLIDIDKALLRKGRLRYKYEFRPLVHEKAEKLACKLGFDPKLLPNGDIPLSDIYNMADTPDAQKKIIKQIGF